MMINPAMPVKKTPNSRLITSKRLAECELTQLDLFALVTNASGKERVLKLYLARITEGHWRLPFSYTLQGVGGKWVQEKR